MWPCRYFIGYPGAKPLKSRGQSFSAVVEKMICNISKAVEYVFSYFYERAACDYRASLCSEKLYKRSFVKLYTEMNKHMDELPNRGNPAVCK